MEKKRKRLNQKVIGIVFLILAAVILVVAIISKSIGSLMASCLLFVLGSFMVGMKAKEFNSPFAFLLIVLMTLPFYILLMITSFKSNTKIWFDSLKLDQWISLYGSLLAYAGTVCLGFVTVAQNKRITDITEKSVNGDIKDKKGFLLPKVYEIRESREFEQCYNVVNSGICFYNAGNDYINDFTLVDYCIDNSEKLFEEAPIRFVGLNGDSQRLYIPLKSIDPKVFESVDRTVFFTFIMTNSKGYSYQQNLKIMLTNCGSCLYKIKGYDTSFSEIKAKNDPQDK